MKNVDELHSRVSSAIWRAERIEEHGPGDAAGEWADVSSLEEELASAIPASEPEGRIARRGAVRAALKAGDYERGHSLAELYMAEEEAPESLREALQEIMGVGTRAAATNSLAATGGIGATGAQAEMARGGSDSGSRAYAGGHRSEGRIGGARPNYP